MLPFQWREWFREDGEHQAGDAVPGGGEQVRQQPHHRADPGGQPPAGVLRQCQDHPQRQLQSLWKIHRGLL